MDIDVKEVWNNALKLLEEELGGTIGFTTYLLDIQPIKILGSGFHVRVSKSIYKNYIEMRYGDIIKNAIHMVTGYYYNLIVDTAEPGAAPAEEQPGGMNTLNRKYTFDSFVVADSNKLAHAAAVAVAETPAIAYNPLFLYGGVGLGKTHLMQAIGNYTLRGNPRSKVVYITAESFTNEFVDSIRDNTNDIFRNKYRQVDMLLIDDIQFIAGKKQTEEGFFHTFDTLHQASKQIVITSDRPPKELQTLEARLRSRFEWGIMVDVAPPDYETRLAILRKKAQIENIEINDEILDIIADKIKSNVRELEGVFNRILAYRSLVNRNITMDVAMDALKDYNLKANKQITPEQIISACCDYFNVPLETLKSAKKTKDVVYARQVAMYLCLELTDLSTSKAGDIFGRDHTTILHGVNKISSQIKENFALKREIEQITEDLKNG